MPLVGYSSTTRPPSTDISGRDLAFRLDIGGNDKLNGLRPDEQLAANMGAGIKDVIKTGFDIGSKIPLLGETADFISKTPVGGAIGAGLQLAALPSEILANLAANVRLKVTGRQDLPTDIQNMLNAGTDTGAIVDYMIKSQRAWSNNQDANLLFTMLTDPLNFTPAVFGKVGMLKPLAAVGGATTGALAAGAVTGGVGFLPGLVAGGFAAARKAGKFATAAESQLARLETAKGLINAGKAVVDEVPELSSAQKAAVILNKQRGLNLGQKLAIGRDAKAAIANAEKSLEMSRKAGNSEGIAIAEEQIATAKKAIEASQAMDEGVLAGMYDVYKTATDGLGEGFKRMGAGLFGANWHGVYKELGGKLNEDVAGLSGIVEHLGKADEVKNMAGRGLANFGIIGTEHIMNGSNKYRAINAAEQIGKLYYDAIDRLILQRGSGAAVKFTTEEVVDEMRSIAKDPVFADTGVVKLFDTGSISELRSRVEFLRNVDPVAAATKEGRRALPQIKQLGNFIESQMNASELGAMRASGITYENKLVGKVKEGGLAEFSRATVDEIQGTKIRLVAKVGSKAQAMTTARQHVTSLVNSMGHSFEEVAPQFDSWFEKTFGDLYTPDGFLKSADSASEAAERMLLVESTGYATSTKTAAMYNTFVDDIMNGNTTALTQRFGKQTVDTLRSIFEKTGKIHIVSSGHIFRDKALAFLDAYSALAKITASLEKAAEKRLGAATSADTIAQDGRVVRAFDRQGGAKEVEKLLKRLNNALASNVEGSEYNKVLKDIISDVRGAKNLDEARLAWTKRATEQFDDVRIVHGDLKNADQINKYLREAVDSGLAVNRFSDRHLSAIEQALRLVGKDPNIVRTFNSGAYRLVRAPENNMIYKPALLEMPGSTPGQRQMWASKVMPFVDMSTSGLQKIAQKNGKAILDYNPNTIQKFMNNLFSPIPQKYVTNSIRRRLAAYLVRGGLGQEHVDAVLDELVARGVQEGVSARGLSPKTVSDSFKKAIDEVGGAGTYKQFVNNFAGNAFGKTFDPMNAVMFAFRGDRNVVGATQYFTGGLKEGKFGTQIAAWTDKWYPTLKFKMNPLYWLQEYAESPILNAARGVDRDTVFSMMADGTKAQMVSASQLRDLTKVGPETQSFVDNANFMAVFRQDAVAQAMTGRYDDIVMQAGVWENLKQGRHLDDLANRKMAARDALALDITAKTFSDTMREKDFNLWSALVEQYGTSDSRAMFTNYVNYRLRLSDPRRVWNDIEVSRPAGVGFGRIPDPERQAWADAQRELITGGRFASEEQVLGQGAGILTQAQLQEQLLANPALHMATLDKHVSSLADAGYDASRFSDSANNLRNALRRAEGELKSTGDMKEETLDMVKAAQKTFHADMQKIGRDWVLLQHKRSALESLATQLHFTDPLGVDPHTGKILEAMLVGQGFSTDIQYIVDEVNDVVNSIVRGGVDPIKDGKAFRDGVQAEMVRRVADKPDLAVKFGNGMSSVVTRHGAEETVYNAFQYAYTMALDQANKTTYFPSARSFFERTINHPGLAMYPYSYMFKKILPEMIEFLFKRPFGAQAPMAGYSAYMHVRDYFEYELETNPGIGIWLDEHPNSVYMLTMMFPGVPWDVTAVPPAWARNLYKRMANGTDWSPGAVLNQDFARSITSIGPLGALETTGSTLDELFKSKTP
jgi:hypothetical protein